MSRLLDLCQTPGGLWRTPELLRTHVFLFCFFLLLFVFLFFSSSVCFLFLSKSSEGGMDATARLIDCLLIFVDYLDLHVSLGVSYAVFS